MTVPQELARMVLITVHPEMVARAALAPVETVVAVGEAPERAMTAYCKALGKESPAFASVRWRARRMGF